MNCCYNSVVPECIFFLTRGAKDFLLSTSSNGGATYTQFASGTLTDPYSVPSCGQPKESFKGDGARTPIATHLKLTLVDFYGWGAGLHSMQVYGVEVPEV